MDVTLIGTDHGDFKGRERLEEMLTRISPDVVAVEMSDAELQFLEKSAAKATKHYLNVGKKKGLPKEHVDFFAEVMLNREALLGYEYCASEHYCQEKDIPIVLIDDPESARITFAQKTKINHKLFHTLPSIQQDMQVPIPPVDDLNKDTDRFYEEASRLMENDATKEHIESYIAPYRLKFFGARDDYMAAKVRETSAQYPTSMLVVVIGWMHMLDDPKGETLYSKIKNFKPQRLLLHQRII